MQPNVSKHLSKLRDMRCVVDERKEKYIYYSLNLNDEAIRSLIRNIVENIVVYPRLNEDRKGLADKDAYLRQCKTKLPD
jgi:ArsR family transcriptional regulator